MRRWNPVQRGQRTSSNIFNSGRQPYATLRYATPLVSVAFLRFRCMMEVVSMKRVTESAVDVKSNGMLGEGVACDVN